MQYLFALSLLLAPIYAVRFYFFGFSANLFMFILAFVCIFFIVWLIYTRRIVEFFQYLKSASKVFIILVVLFFLSGAISLFIQGFSEVKLGQFIVLFLEPVAVFLASSFFFSVHPEKRAFVVKAAFATVAFYGILAIIQYFTLWTLPIPFWGNSNEPKRAVSFFLHPNFYALFTAPLLAFLFPTVMKNFSIQSWFTKFLWLIGAIGLFLSLSRGGWVGLGISVVIFILVYASKKQIKLALVVFILTSVLVLSIPNFRYRLLLPFYGEKSSVARLSLWHTGWKMVESSPITGFGLLGFSNNWDKFNTDPNLNHYPAPHNIFLNFWVDTGFIGLVSFFGLCIFILRKKNWQQPDLFTLGVALSVVSILVQGLVDIPYFKNDLAFQFWLLASLVNIKTV